MTIKLKKLNDKAIIPTRGSDKAAGFDLYACLSEDKMTIEPHTTRMVHTGIAIQLPPETFGAIYARSGLSAKRSLRPANCVGVIDEDYTGELMVALHNDGEIFQTISNGERIAQLIVLPYVRTSFDIVEELNETERGAGGFGSTGTH